MFSLPSRSPPALTPLPAPLSIRSTTSRASQSTLTPTSATPFWCRANSPPEAGAGGGIAEWGAGGYVGVLSRDPRQTVVGRGRSGSDVHLMPGGMGILGRDAPLLLNELHRARTASSRARVRKFALWSGLLTLLILGYTVWYIFEVVWAIVRAGTAGRGMVRWIEAGAGAAAMLGCGVVVGWLRTRRPTRLSTLALLVAITTFALHVTLAISNLALAIIWHDALARRCTWGIDVGWDLGASGRECAEGNLWSGWVITAGVRLLLTICIGATWLILLRQFHASLSISTILSPSLAPSSETRTISHRGTAFLHSSPSPLASPSLSHTADYLPPMPDRSRHYALVSESTMYEEKTGSPSFGVRIGAAVMGAVGWLLGVEPFDPSKAEESRRDKGEKEAMLLRAEGHLPVDQREVDEFGRMGERVYSPVDLDDPYAQHDRTRREDPTYPTYPPFESTSSPRTSTSNHSEAPSYRALFKNLASNPTPSTSSLPPSAPMLDRPPSPSSSSSRSLTPPPDDPPSRLSHTGSSGSTGGSIVFVRMSDGRLVRKLSTIASEGSRMGSEEGTAGGWRGGWR